MRVIEVLPGRTALHLLRFAVGQAYLWCVGAELTPLGHGGPVVGGAAGALRASARTYDEVQPSSSAAGSPGA
ncbi:hypothetical protein ACWGDT_00525 [Streptomyces avermitilis]